MTAPLHLYDTDLIYRLNKHITDARPMDASFLAAAGILAAVIFFAPFEALVAGSASPQPLKVAFIGDQGMGPGAREVLELIKIEDADMVLHQGDFDYHDNPEAWDAMITDILGVDFSYFASIGNHDRERWGGSDGYGAKLRARLRRIDGAQCSGDLGIMSACTFGGLFFVLSGIGTLPEDSPDDPRHVAYLRDQLARTHAIWRICSWHKNQAAVQTGRKGNNVGWEAYEICREAGAIIATAHEHAYSRTHLLNDFETQSVASRDNTLVIEAGKSFAFVSGLGGKSIRDQDNDGRWWASTYTSDQGAQFGALFCTFNVNGDRRRAHCYFRDIYGRIPDSFSVISRVGVDVGGAQGGNESTGCGVK